MWKCNTKLLEKVDNDPPLSTEYKVVLKVNSTDFTLQSVFTGLGEFCMCEISCIKTAVASGAAVGI